MSGPPASAPLTARIPPTVSDVRPQSLAGKVALVTGSSSGIGAAIVRELSTRGASVVINYPSAAEKDAAQALGASLSTPWTAVEADVSTADGPGALVAAVADAFGGIDVLVNNAGRARLAPFEEATAAMFDEAVGTNARGALLATQAALPHLPPAGGRVVFVSSAVVAQPEVHQAVYASSKAAAHALMLALARELPPKYGCTVNAVAPGPVDTPGFTREFEKSGKFLYNVFDARTPVAGYIGLPEDVAHAVMFFLDERADWVNGASINVSGGMFMG